MTNQTPNYSPPEVLELLEELLAQKSLLSGQLDYELEHDFDALDSEELDSKSLRLREINCVIRRTDHVIDLFCAANQITRKNGRF